MDTPDISIIIPVFNAEKIISRCINSVLQQTVSQFEIICIDDGSTDMSVEQIKMLQKQFPQILLLTQEHAGAGPARNLGIRSAKGKYIAFLDVDDEFVDADALAMMVKACMKYQAYICGSFRKFLVDNEEKDSEIFANYEIPLVGCFIEYSDFQYDYDYQSFIFNREFLMKNNIYFPSYIRYQDPPFFVRAMSTAERFYVMPITLYKYRFDPVKQSTVVEKNICYILQGIQDTLEIARDKDYHTLFENIVRRIEVDFYDVIMRNLSDESMLLILKINNIVQQFQNRNLNILTDIYSGIKDIRGVIYSHDLLRKIVLIKQHGNGFQTYFEQHEIRNVAVYGLGAYGEILINELEICGIKIVCGIDRSVKIYKDLLVIQPEDEIPECDALIVSLMEPREIVRHYETSKRFSVYSFTQIIYELAASYQLVGS